MTSRRVPAWKIVAGIVAALAGVALILIVWIKAAEARRWKELEQLVQELKAEVGARDCRRPVLRGEPLPGDASEDYAAALRQIEESTKGTPSYLIDDSPEVVAGIERAVARLRQGASRGSSRNLWIEGWMGTTEGDPDWSSLPRAQRLVSETLFLARQRRQAGRHREAAEMILDAALFARDLAYNGEFVLCNTGNQMLQECADALQETLLKAAKDPETCRQIDRELEVLDRSMNRSGYRICNWVAHEAGALIRTGTWEWFGYDIDERPGWRYAFSRRLMAADGARQLVAWARRTLDLDDLPWDEGGRERDEFLWDEKAHEDNAILRAAAKMEDVWAGDQRTIHSRFHLLRLAAHYLATGEILEIPDPYGKKLLHVQKGTKLKAWSLCGAQENLKVEGGSGHMVIEVER